MYEFDPLEPEDPRTIGGYPLRARIGAGGMGRVYLSFTPGGRAVAVKVIRREFGSDPEFRERFAREVSIAQQVNGIHIAQLIDAGSDDGVPWLAGAYVAGPSLAQAVAASGPLPAHTVLALAGRIAGSLAAIHATGMVHRDLKPGNILLDESGPKVIDFGIVRAATPTATGRSSHRTFIGSPPFMAPEQIRGQKVTPATDVFALGATLYFLATGESAFAADFADGVLYRVIHDEPDYAALPEQIRELVRVCLRKDPAERPSTDRIIEGCRAAGAGPDTPLPDAVLAMIRERAQALRELTAAPDPDPTVDDDETVGESPETTAPDPTPVLDVHSMPTAVPDPTPLLELSSEPPPPSPRPRRSRTLLVAGSSSLVTAIAAVAVAVLIWPHTTAGNPNNPNQPTGHSSSGAQSSGPATTGSSPAGPDVVQWQGQVMVTVNQVDLDSVPVNNGASSGVSLYDSTISISGDGPYQLTALPAGAATLATWSGTGTPTRSQCYDQVSSQGVERVTVSNGTQVCDITAGSRVALLKVLNDTADGGDGILTYVTVWSSVIPSASTG